MVRSVCPCSSREHSIWPVKVRSQDELQHVPLSIEDEDLQSSLKINDGALSNFSVPHLATSHSHLTHTLFTPAPSRSCRLP